MRSLCFEGWQIDSAARELRVAGRPVHVEPRVFDLLLYLALRPDRVVSKQELRSQVWEGVPVSDWALARAVKEARRALGDPARDQLRTVRGRGLRLVSAPPGEAPDELRDPVAGSLARGGRRGLTPTPTTEEPGERVSLLNAIEQDLAAASAGRGRLVLVTGEAGIGKSWLASAALERARAAGRLALLGSAPELGPQLAYRAWSHALRGLFESGLVRDGELPPAAREAFLRAMPELADWLAPAPGTTPRPEGPVASARASFRLAGHLRLLLARLARSRGAGLLVLEDLHRAGVASLDLLEAFARELAELPLVVIGTARDTEWALHQPERPRLEQLAALPVARVAPLDGLRVGELQRLVEAETGATTSRATASRLRDWTGGNAFHALALLRTPGALAALQQGDAPPLEKLSVLLRKGLLRHLRAAPPSCRSLLALASMVGRVFEVELLAEVSGRSVLEVERDLRPGVEARLLEPCDTAGRRLRFVHALLAEALQREVPADELQSFHEALADALIRRAPGERHAALVAHHLAAAANAGRLAEAIDYQRVAASQARAQHAFAEAVGYLREARSLLDRLPESGPVSAIELDVELGEALVLGHAVEEGRRLLDETAQRAARSGASEWLGRAALAYAGLEESPGPDPARIRILELAARALDRMDATLAVRIRCRLAQALQDDADRARRERLAHTALAEARALGEPDLVCDAIRSLHFAAFTPENPDEREQWAREELELARWLDDPQRVHDATMDLVADLLEAGELDAVDRELAAHRRLLEATPELLYAWHHAHYRVMRALVDGALDEAERELERARALGERTGYELAGQWHAMQLYTLRLQQERLAELAPALAAVAHATPLAAWQLAAGLAGTRAGDTGPAREALSRWTGPEGLRLPRDHTWILSACLVAMLARELGATREERTAAEALQPFADRHATIYGMIDWGPVAKLAGAGTSRAEAAVP